MGLFLSDSFHSLESKCVILHCDGMHSWLMCPAQYRNAGYHRMRQYACRSSFGGRRQCRKIYELNRKHLYANAWEWERATMSKRPGSDIDSERDISVQCGSPSKMTWLAPHRSSRDREGITNPTVHSDQEEQLKLNQSTLKTLLRLKPPIAQ